MKTPHKYAELIKAWADGAEIEYSTNNGLHWNPILLGWSWDNTRDAAYRIKPEPKPDVVRYGMAVDNRYSSLTLEALLTSNVKFTFDGETGALKAAEVL